MEAIAITIRNAGLADNVYPYQPRSYSAPCVIVNYPPPGQLQFNKTSKHGMYAAIFEVDFIVGSVDGLEARDALSDFFKKQISVVIADQVGDRFSW